MQTHPPQFSLLSGFYSSDRDFACRFLQIPPHDGHPCGSASGSHYQAHSGLSPPSYRPCRAHITNSKVTNFRVSNIIATDLFFHVYQIVYYYSARYHVFIHSSANSSISFHASPNFHLLLVLSTCSFLCQVLQ